MWTGKKRKKIEIKPIGDSRPYVLWRRVSTQEQEASGLGLEAQLTIAKMFMAKDPVAVFTDVHSGTKLKECGQLWEAIRYCKASDYVLCIAKSDRLRSVSEALDIIDAMGERNVVICDLPTCDRFVLTIMFAVGASGADDTDKHTSCLGGTSAPDSGERRVLLQVWALGEETWQSEGMYAKAGDSGRQ